MGKREFQPRRQQLLDVRAADVLSLLNLDDTEDLHPTSETSKRFETNSDIRGSSGSEHGA